MRIIALLSFYDEPPKALTLCVEGLHRAGVDHLVAVDGAYALYPDGKPDSPAEQRGVIDAACRHFGLGLTMHVPQTSWQGNEIEKRSFLFAAGWLNAQPGDWLMVMDADQFVVESPANLKQQLTECGKDVAEVTFIDVQAQAAGREDWPERFSVPILFRAQPIHVEQNHYTYVATETRRVLWGKHVEPGSGYDLRDEFVIEHHHEVRSAERRHAKAVYYGDRDTAGIEVTDKCQRCNATTAQVRRHGKLRRSPKLKAPVADIVDLCHSCAREIDRVNRRRLITWGYDPDVQILQRTADPEIAAGVLGR
jgi:hypothetical protein